MATYALVENELVINMIEWDGDTDNWEVPEGVTAVLVPEGLDAGIGYTYIGGSFTAPPAPPAPPPTAQQVLAQRDVLLAEATLRIDPLADAVELDDATPAEVAALKAWRQYRVALNRIEQQAGFSAAVVWPSKPA